ncbi:YdcF family protein [Neisseriaceae bacterium ESL0693]|nr:YdcF family protein [Neisseriaceae bacterium ESL0693]
MKKRKRHGFWRHIMQGILISAGLLLINYGFCVYQVYRYSQPKPLHHADAALILGAAAWDKHPSPVFRERINHALILYQQGMVDKLIFTGGTPKTGYMTEAAVGRRYAIKKGVDKNDIVYENQSRDTWQNLVNAQAIAANNDIDSLIIVSDPFHLARAAIMARDLGMNNIQISPTPTTRYNSLMSKLPFLTQESGSLMMYYWSHALTSIIKHKPAS